MTDHLETVRDALGEESSDFSPELDESGFAPLEKLRDGAAPHSRKSVRVAGQRVVSPSGMASSAGAKDATMYVFNTCQVSVTLRAVAFLELWLAALCLFGADTVMAWLISFAYATAAILPAAMLWTLLVCACKKWLHHQSEAVQWLFTLALGAACGVVACAVMTFGGASPHVGVWGGSACVGMLLAALMVTLLKLRMSISAPATAAARLNELQSRIRPHFLFNTINSAIALIRVEPRKAESVLTDLCVLFRTVLQGENRESTLADELDLAKRYLEIERVRFDDRLRVQWDVQVDASTVRLPVLTLQPLVENAVRHGVEPSPSGADIWVRCLKHQQSVRIEVLNTTSADAEAHQPGNGIALRNVRERLQLMYDLECQFKAGMRKDGVFGVRIALPAVN